MNRRDFLWRAGIGGAAAMAANRAIAGKMAVPFFAAHHLPIGLQLFTLSAQLDADFPGTLSAISRIGFRTVELAGFYGRSGADLRTAFDRANLRCPSAHISPKSYAPPARPNDDLDLSGDIGRLAAELHAIGVETVVMAAFIAPERLAGTPLNLQTFRIVGSAMTADDWQRTADFLNEKGKALAREGLRLNYHNHNFEFKPLGDTCGFDILMAQTDPAHVGFELDVGWVAAAGIDTAALLEANPHRIRQMHVKDIKAGTPSNFDLAQQPTEVGQGIIDWQDILPCAYRHGVREFFIEREPPYDGDRLALIETSFHYLERLRN